MSLPKQSPPVKRTVNVEAKARQQGVKPQMICQCREVNGVRTKWCLIGKSFYDTKEKC
jgi:hypothetical protein